MTQVWPEDDSEDWSDEDFDEYWIWDDAASDSE